MTNIAVAALLGVTVWLALDTSHVAFARQAGTVTEGLTASTAAAIASELKLVDNALLSVRTEVAAAGGLQRLGPDGAQRALEKQRALVPWVPALRIADAEGVVRQGAGVNPARLPRVADRAYFTQARDQAGDAAVLSEPLLSRNDGRWGVAMARALFGTDGRFEGIVYAALPIEHFERLLGRLDVGEHGAVTLRTASLQLVARVAGGRPSSGKVGSADVSPQLTHALEQSPQKGAFASRTALDGIERTNAYQRIEPYGLVVLTGLASQEFYAPWRREAAQLATLTLIILVVLGGASVLLVRSRRAKQAALESLAELTREQSAMLDNELIGIVKATDRKTVWMNKAMERIFGYRAAELIGHSARLLHVDDASYESLAAAYPAMDGGQHFRTQLQMRHKSGEPIWIDLTGTMLSPTETLWLMADVTLQKRNEDQMRHAATHDALTGLPNRAMLSDRLDEALRSAEQLQQAVAIAMLDLDEFKAVNDRYGHGAGDALLVEVARRLQLGVRGHDTVARLGGDEFVVVLTGLSKNEDSTATVQRLLADLQRPVGIGAGVMASVGVSIGVAFYPSDGREAGALVSAADQRMFDAKRSGRNRVVSTTAPRTDPPLQLVATTKKSGMPLGQ